MSDIISRLILRIELPGGNMNPQRAKAKCTWPLIYLALNFSACGTDPLEETNPETVPNTYEHALPHFAVEALPATEDPTQPSNPDTEDTSAPQSGIFGIPVDGCNLPYNFTYSVEDDWLPPGPAAEANSNVQNESASVDPVAHLEPLPESTWQFPILRNSSFTAKQVPAESLTMPGYTDSMPLFERGIAWQEDETRCYELPHGAELLTQEQAYNMYVDMIRKMLWYEVNQTAEFRTVIGIRGSHPGIFDWNGNLPDRFNDTIVLLWKDSDGTSHVREFPVNTDTGARDFGYHSSSSLKPNRHYSYTNGWHRSYNALRMNEYGYTVRDDSNKNGHWDGDRNGWQSGGPADHDREGSAHNIHMAAKDAPLNTAAVQNWSAGCQVIPGAANWTEFITNAWTQSQDQVDYYLLDTRDIPQSLWNGCDAEAGTYACPWEVRSFPFNHSGNTSLSTENQVNQYNCSTANESGPEVRYVLNIREPGTLTVSVSVEDESSIDPDVHLLWGDDSNACLARGHRAFSQWVSPGRYMVVVDTWVNENGDVLTGSYDLNITFD